MKTVYLDNNATTSVAPEVVEEIVKWSRDSFANPSSLHFLGQDVSRGLLEARKKIASSIGVNEDEVVFTASGSESNNLCIKGYCDELELNGARGHIITSSIEHPSVVNAMRRLEKRGFGVTFLDVDNEGFVSPDVLMSAFRPETVLVSIMHANNEIGSVQDVYDIARICVERNIVFHTDAVQSFLKVPLDLGSSGVALASFSGHKIHTPKGIGFAYVRRGIKIQCQIDGGGQEFGLRSGTENTAYIAGLAMAVSTYNESDVVRMKELQSYLMKRLGEVDGVRINGPLNTERRVCNNVNFSVFGLEGEHVLGEFSRRGICVSTGSACSAKSTKISPVLQAIRCPGEYINGNVRVSTSKYTTKEEVDVFMASLSEIIGSGQRLRLV